VIIQFLTGIELSNRRSSNEAPKAIYVQLKHIARSQADGVTFIVSGDVLITVKGTFHNLSRLPAVKKKEALWTSSN